MTPEKIAEQSTTAKIEAESRAAEYVPEIDTRKQVLGGKIGYPRETA